MLETQRHSETEKSQLHEEFEHERRKLTMEATEMDRVVEKMSNELERYLMENEELRARLRNIMTTSTPSYSVGGGGPGSGGSSGPVPLPAGTFKGPPPPGQQQSTPGAGPVPLPVRYNQ